MAYAARKIVKETLAPNDLAVRSRCSTRNTRLKPDMNLEISRRTSASYIVIRNRTFTEWRKHHCSLHSYWQAVNRFQGNGFKSSFYDVPVVTDFFKAKIDAYLGKFGLSLLHVANPDHLPLPFRTNFYIKAEKKD